MKTKCVLHLMFTHSSLCSQFLIALKSLCKGHRAKRTVNLRRIGNDEQPTFVAIEKGVSFGILIHRLYNLMEPFTQSKTFYVSVNITKCI